MIELTITRRLGVFDIYMKFFDARIFNQDISNWDVRKVLDFSEMVRLSLVRCVYILYIFIYGELLICNSLTRVLHINRIFIMPFQKANDFNQNISGWTVTSAKEMQFMVRLFKFYRCFMPWIPFY